MSSKEMWDMQPYVEELEEPEEQAAPDWGMSKYLTRMLQEIMEQGTHAGDTLSPGQENSPRVRSGEFVNGSLGVGK